MSKGRWPSKQGWRCTGSFACALLVATSAHAQRAEVYPQNPLRTPAPEWRALPLAPAGSSLENSRVVVRSCLDRGRVVSLATTSGAMKVRACTLAALAKKNQRGDYSAPALDVPEATAATRAEPDAFAEISAYYHVTRALVFFEQLGFPGLPGPLSVVVSARIASGLRERDLGRLADTELPLEPLPGSFHLPRGPLAALFGAEPPLLVFGQGYARDFAYDGDIVAHEVAHAVLKGTLEGGSVLREDGTSFEPAALVEGLADYLAAALSADPLIAEYAAGEVPGGLGTRSLESRARCPESLTGDPHGDGQVVSTALWAARNGLAFAERPLLDRFVLGAALALPAHAPQGFAPFFRLLRERLGAHLPAALPLLEQALLARGLSKEAGHGCVAVRELSPSQSLSGAGGPFLAPGQGQPGILQLRVQPPQGARLLHLGMIAAEHKPHIISHPDLGAPAITPDVSARVTKAPFAPRLLGRYAGPLRWALVNGRYENDTELSAAFTRSGKRWEATLPLMEAAGTPLHLQLVNAGQDGWYDVLTVRYTSDPQPAPPEAVAPATPSGRWGCAMSAASPEPESLRVVALMLSLAFALLPWRRRAHSVTHWFTSLLHSKPSAQSD